MIASSNNNNTASSDDNNVVADENTPNAKRNILPAQKKKAWLANATTKNKKKDILMAKPSNGTPTKHCKKSANEDNVKVYVRIRPQPQDDLHASASSSISAISKKEIHFNNGLDNGGKKFSVDSVFGTTSTQNNIFVQVGKPVVDSALQGYNGTVLAYGQTGSGKTYTMLGTPADPGLIPRVCQYLFSQVDSIKKKDNASNACKKKKSFKNSNASISQEINVSVSYLEIYQENVLDLLDIEAGKKDLREDTKKKCVYVENLMEKEVKSPKEAAEWMAIGNTNRKTGSTKMNSESSRSHAVFTLSLEIHSTNKKTGAQTKRTSKINLVDLAGSERQQNTGATGARLKEGATINKSLSALGNVIKSLVSKRKWHVAYRDSKLTFLLRDSLGGNAQTSMIAAVSPEVKNRFESLSTLEFVKRAKCIKNKVVKNEDTIGTNEALRNQLKMLQHRNHELESEVITLKEATNYNKEQEAMKEKLTDALERANAAEMQLETLTLHHAMSNRRESSTSASSANRKHTNDPRISKASLDGNDSRDSMLFSPLCSTISHSKSSSKDLELSEHDVQKLEWRQSIEALNIECRRQSLVDGKTDTDGGIEGPLLTMQVETLKHEIEALSNELQESKQENIALNDHVNILEDNARLLEYKYDVKVKDMMKLVREKEEWLKANNKMDLLNEKICKQNEIIYQLQDENEKLLHEIIGAKMNDMVNTVEQQHVAQIVSVPKSKVQVTVQAKIYKQLHNFQMHKLRKEIGKAKGVAFLTRKMKKKKKKTRFLASSREKLPTQVAKTNNETVAKSDDTKTSTKVIKSKKKATTLKDLDIQFQHYNVLPECLNAKGKKLIYFVPKNLKLNGTATLEELENGSVNMKKMYAKDVLEFLNNMLDNSSTNYTSQQNDTKINDDNNQNMLEKAVVSEGGKTDAFTTFVNENAKSVGNTSRQILRKSILKAFLIKFKLHDESLFKKIEKHFKRQTQVYDILRLNNDDIEELKFNDNDKENLKLAKEDETMKAFVQDIQDKEEEAEIRAKEGENRYNQAVEMFINQYNKLIADKYVDALRIKMENEGMEDTWEYYTSALTKTMSLKENSEFEILKFSIVENKLSLGKAVINLNKEKNNDNIKNIDINKKLVYDGSTVFHIACRNGNIRFVKFLYNEFEANGLNINAIDNEQTTPLMEAVYNDNVSVVKFLLEQGVEMYHDDKDGNTAMSFALEKKHERCIKLLEKYEEEETDESEEERMADELDDLMMGENEDDVGDARTEIEENIVNNVAAIGTTVVASKRSNRPQRKARMSVVTYNEQVSDGDSDDAWSASEMIEEEEEDDSDYE
jgi:hypothetical protein